MVDAALATSPYVAFENRSERLSLGLRQGPRDQNGRRRRRRSETRCLGRLLPGQDIGAPSSSWLTRRNDRIDNSWCSDPHNTCLVFASGNGRLTCNRSRCADPVTKKLPSTASIEDNPRPGKSMQTKDYGVSPFRREATVSTSLSLLSSVNTACSNFRCQGTHENSAQFPRIARNWTPQTLKASGRAWR